MVGTCFEKLSKIEMNDIYLTDNPQITLFKVDPKINWISLSSHLKEYYISSSSGYHNGIYYVCSTCNGHSCSDCRYMPPENISPATFVLLNDRQIVSKNGQNIKNKI